ncbi:hypothetical protein GTP58_11930 [Duganella sp. CY15W]|uniref:phosphoribosyltransferase-like protein n=1 Tax=Duganella sp. CY15W TaxID=2692172 RepID=UPI001370D4D5|nr:hypothetical protein [Duganella sp. CY15W]MYM29029.1 hypothetical protein [Duganella sp. CY15W]
MRHKELPVERWQYLVQVGLWPPKRIFDPVGWMGNFDDEEIKYALRLLEGFTYFAPDLMAQMFKTAFLSLSQIIVTDKSSYSNAQKQWSEFVESVLIVRVTGESPNDSDSGYIYSRLARTKLGIPEERIVSHEEACYIIARDSSPHNIVFVDDFVGSGSQFIETWTRTNNIIGYAGSFEVISKLNVKAKFYYCPVICTEEGKKNIKESCPNVIVVPAHFYSSRHSALSSDSVIWRDDMRITGPEFVRKASARAGLPDLDGEQGCWQGFQKLGLAIGFNEYAPDATLPIFTTTKNGWKPLIRV